jgi:hypothetical protein
VESLSGTASAAVVHYLTDKQTPSGDLGVAAAGSVQTVGQNILIHVGKNRDNSAWFATSYGASYRLGADKPLDEIERRRMRSLRSTFPPPIS